MSAVSRPLNHIFGRILTSLVLPAVVALCSSTMALAAPPLPGAIFTTALAHGQATGRMLALFDGVHAGFLVAGGVAMLGVAVSAVRE